MSESPDPKIIDTSIVSPQKIQQHGVPSMNFPTLGEAQPPVPIAPSAPKSEVLTAEQIPSEIKAKIQEMKNSGLNMQEVQMVANQVRASEMNIPNEVEDKDENLDTLPLEADLSMLAMSGRIEKKVRVKSSNGKAFEFIMNTLNGEEQTEAYVLVSRYADAIARANAIRIAILSYAIQTINGVPLESFYQDKNKKDLELQEQKFRVIQSWQQSFIFEVFDKWTKEVEQAGLNAVSGDFTKKIKN